MLQPRSISPIGSSSPALLQRLGLGQGPTTTAPTPSPNQDNNRPPGLLDDYMVEQVAAYSKAMGELASSHPEAYASFVRAQDEAAAALAAAHSEYVARSLNGLVDRLDKSLILTHILRRTSTGRVIIPEPGFVVRASITPAGPRISEAKAGAESARSQPLLVNIVSHHAVQRPVVSSPSLSSSSGTAVLVEEEQGWTGASKYLVVLGPDVLAVLAYHPSIPDNSCDTYPYPADLGIQVPLLIGARRSTTARSVDPDTLSYPSFKQNPPFRLLNSDTTVDVLVNPWVVREALKHRPLQAQVVNLALEWVAEETGLDVRADEPCVVLPAAVCSYWDNSEQQWGGGGGAGKPRPFILDEVALQL